MRADELATPFYGWRSPIGNSGGGALAAFEAFGEQTAEELSERLGISRARDFERRKLSVLVDMGAVEHRDGGRYGLPEDHRAVSERLWTERYATSRKRKTRTRTDEGRVVVEVEETVVDASEAERCEKRREDHRKQREIFRDLQRVDGPEGDDACRQLLNAWDEEREALHNTPGRGLAPVVPDGSGRGTRHPTMRRLSGARRKCSSWRVRSSGLARARQTTTMQGRYRHEGSDVAVDR